MALVRISEPNRGNFFPRPSRCDLAGDLVTGHHTNRSGSGAHEPCVDGESQIFSMMPCSIGLPNGFRNLGNQWIGPVLFCANKYQAFNLWLMVCSLLPSSAQMQLAIEKSQAFASTQKGGLLSLCVEWPMNVSNHGLHYTGSCCLRAASWISMSTGKHHVCETRPGATVDELSRSRHRDLARGHLARSVLLISSETEVFADAT
jgi:hypothetical protein